MTPTTYNYTKAIISDQLEAQIRASAITVALDHTETVGLEVSLVFKDVLTNEEKTILDTIVANHSPVPEVTPVTPRNVDGVPIVELAMRKGRAGTSNFTIVSPDFSDRTQWYQKSIQVTDETLNSTDGGLSFKGSKAHWINMESKKLTVDYKKVLERDGTLSAKTKRAVIVKVDGVVQAKTAYSVNFVTGVVTFSAAKTGVVTATYWHNDGVANHSEFLLVPPPGFAYRIHHIECQFSRTSMFPEPIMVEIWAGAVTPVNGKPSVNVAGYWNFSDTAYDAGYGQSRSEYRNMNDLINWCTNSYPVIPACGELQDDIMCFPFLYIVHPEVSSAQGTLIRVKNVGDTPLTAEISTVTFYMEKVVI